MAPYGTLLLIGLALSLPAACEDYAAIFGREYVDADQFLQQNGWIGESLGLPAGDTRIAEAVVFPEVLRYRILEDEIQVRALKVLYVQFGQKYANFSIGHFQMKPSFAEQLEADYNRLFSAREKTAAGITPFDLDASMHLRNERVLRLEDLHGQAQYLRLFMLTMGKRYASLTFANDAAKLRFYATAYNAGYAQGETALRKLMGVRWFHVQLLIPETRYNYGDVAVYYFNHQQAEASRCPPVMPERPDSNAGLKK